MTTTTVSVRGWMDDDDDDLPHNYCALTDLSLEMRELRMTYRWTDVPRDDPTSWTLII